MLSSENLVKIQLKKALSFRATEQLPSYHLLVDYEVLSRDGLFFGSCMGLSRDGQRRVKRRVSCIPNASISFRVFNLLYNSFFRRGWSLAQEIFHRVGWESAQLIEMSYADGFS